MAPLLVLEVPIDIGKHRVEQVALAHTGIADDEIDVRPAEGAVGVGEQMVERIGGRLRARPRRPALDPPIGLRYAPLPPVGLGANALRHELRVARPQQPRFSQLEQILRSGASAALSRPRLDTDRPTFLLKGVVEKLCVGPHLRAGGLGRQLKGAAKSEWLRQQDDRFPFRLGSRGAVGKHHAGLDRRGHGERGPDPEMAQVAVDLFLGVHNAGTIELCPVTGSVEKRDYECNVRVIHHFTPQCTRREA